MNKLILPGLIILAGLLISWFIVCGGPTCSASDSGKMNENNLVGKVANKEAILLDVRRDEEWQAGHAVGAIHWDLAKLQAGQMPNIPKDADIQTYCRTGNRAGVARNIMLQNGYRKVANLGGLSDWEKMGGKVVSGE
ncbi:MAG TPA: rhodanese-like domain-containing protein [Candidatus Paceibacterota bacterium]